MGLHFLADQGHELVERRQLPQLAVDLAGELHGPEQGGRRAQPGWRWKMNGEWRKTSAV